MGQRYDLDLCVSEKRATLSEKSPSYVNNLERKREREKGKGDRRRELGRQKQIQNK